MSASAQSATPAASPTPSGAASPSAAESPAGRLRGARLVYVGAEGALLFGKSTAGQSAALLAIDPDVEVSLTPRWSVQAHALFAAGLSTLYQPKSWWDVGVRGFWRPPFLPAQSIGAGLGLGQARERRSGRSQFEPVTPHLDAQIGVWEFDFDPVRFGPALNAAVNFDGSYFFGLGVVAQFGFGPIRTTR